VGPPVIVGERVNLIDDDDLEPLEQPARGDPRAHEHRLERLRRRHEDIRRMVEEPTTLCRPDVAVPLEDAATDRRGISRHPLLLVIEKRANRRRIDHRHGAQVFRVHAGEHREERGFRLSPSGRREDDAVLAVEHVRDRQLLNGPELGDPERLRDLVLERRGESVKRAHEPSLDGSFFVPRSSAMSSTDRSTPRGFPLFGGHLGRRDNELEVAFRDVVLVLLDLVEQLAHELPEEEPWRGANPLPQLSRHSVREETDCVIVDSFGDSFRVLRRIQVPHFPTHFDEPIHVEWGESHLRRQRAVEPRVAGEVDVDPLLERRQALDPLRPLEERRCSSHDDEHPGIAARVEIVHGLAEGVQALLAQVRSHPLNRLALIEDKEQSFASGLPQ
jgi:hypothetical protein